ncbi:VanW family protein [Deinococcus aquaedulcis]|uniref:VanW family protein n=1 Tax=Deinococcus aquaedulcis TaxID=2840455 RepID=UPI001F223858|nr:VanW family protein [Deinococcus aquaedulcis]
MKPVVHVVSLLALGGVVLGSLLAPPAPPRAEPNPPVPVQVAAASRPAAPATLTLRWSVPEPQLVGPQLQRPLLHRSVTLPLRAQDVMAARQGGNLTGLRQALDRAYARIEARVPRDIRFRRTAQGWVGEAVTGWTLDRRAADGAVLDALRAGQDGARLPVKLRAPARSVRWAQAQGLQHVATGTSSFAGSPEFRVHNIRVGAARLQGTWLAAGATFNFNALVGLVAARTGFRPGYVVTGRTLALEDGGGLCQVSTTVFRAALRSGVPITERHAHSYQVGYYGDPGQDAAVYAPSKNLRWRNDFRSVVLVQTEWDVAREQLSVHLFARPDGRRVQLAPVQVSGVAAAPAPTYMVDPAMAPDEVRRVDMPAPGAQAKVVRQVLWPGGTRRTDVIRSSYRAWGGVFAVAPGDPRARR